MLSSGDMLRTRQKSIGLCSCADACRPRALNSALLPEAHIADCMGKAVEALRDLFADRRWVHSCFKAGGQRTQHLVLKAQLASPIFTGTVSSITKAMVGLGNVDNSADADKPI